MFLGGQPRPIPRSGAPALPSPSHEKIVGSPTTKFGLVIKLDKRKIFTGSPRPHPGRKFCDTNAEARSFCGSEPSCYSILSVFTDDIPYTLTALFMFRCMHNSFYTQLVHLYATFSPAYITHLLLYSCICFCGLNNDEMR